MCLTAVVFRVALMVRMSSAFHTVGHLLLLAQGVPSSRQISCRLSKRLVYLFLMNVFLRILNRSALSFLRVGNIFSQSVAHVFVSVRAFLNKEKFLILVKSNLSILYLVFSIFCILSKKSVYSQGLKDNSPTFSSGIVIVLATEFRSKIYCDLIIVYGVR